MAFLSDAGIVRHFVGAVRRVGDPTLTEAHARVEHRAHVARTPPTLAVEIAIVCALTLFAFVLRIAGTSSMLPHFAHYDERVYVTQLRAVRDGFVDPENARRCANYPDLVPRLCAWFTKPPSTASNARAVVSGSIPELPPGLAVPRTLDEHLAAASRDARDLRVVVELLSLLAVPGTWLLARRFLAPWWALCATTFCATSVLLQWYAQEARPHAAFAGTSLLAMIALFRLQRRPTLVAYVVAGFAVAIAIATLQSGLALLIPLVVAHATRRDAGPRDRWRFAASWLVIAVLVPWFYPALFDGLLPTDGSRAFLGPHVEAWGHVLYLDWFNGRGFARVGRALVDYEPVFAAVLLVGSVWGTRAWFLRSRKDRMRAARTVDVDARAQLVVAASFVLPYLLAIGLYQGTYQRFLAPLLPYAACAVAWVLSATTTAWSARSRRREMRVAGFAIMVLAFGIQSSAAVRFAWLRARPDTAELASRWIREHVHPGSDRILLMPTLDVPLMRDADGLDASLEVSRGDVRPWIAYQAALSGVERGSTSTYALRAMPVKTARALDTFETDMREYVAELRGEFAVVQDFGPDIRRRLGKLRAELRATGAPLVRIEAGTAGSETLLPYWDTEGGSESWFFWRAFRLDALGAPIEIYALRRP